MKKKWSLMSMKYKNLYTIVSDIKDKRGQRVLINLDVYNGDKYITSYNFELELKKMGLNKKMDYEYQLSKDLNRVVRRYYNIKKKLPTIETIQNKMHHKNYLIISNSTRLNYKEINKKIKEFNRMCGDWDYRNTDMTDVHLGGIEIKYRAIKMYCEKYDVDLDNYIICYSGRVNNQNYLKNFIELDLENREKVLEYISSLEDCIDWKKVDNDLDKIKEKLSNETNEKEMEMM